jgi:leucyl/phenylalanyl-tRNA---protein transferase
MNPRQKIPVLGLSLRFPDPRTAQADGLVALGGDLTVARLIEAYGRGIFPWSASPITWWSPDPRGIFELEDFHLSKRVQRKIRQGRFRFSLDEAFDDVIKACAAAAPGREETWIEPELMKAYLQLHEEGYAHSVECWEGESLVGGAYGVVLGGLFAGESMFSRVSDGSKMAVAYLIDHLRNQRFTLFDTQMVTPHTERLGAREIPREIYLQRLAQALQQPCAF